MLAMLTPHSSETSGMPTVSRIGLIAGQGQLPVEVAKYAKIYGIEVIPYVIAKDNADALKKQTQQTPRQVVPGLLNRTLAMLKADHIDHLVFAGKVNKWILLRDPRLDERALRCLSQATLSDDDLMLWITEELTREGLTVLPQTRFLRHLFEPSGCLTNQQPSERDWLDIRYGFYIAKEMGRIDIGQTVVVKNGMVIAVEAIEGTDECLKRAGTLSKKNGGVVVKVAKPDQDQRFDVPTVGLKTLQTMKRRNLNVLAIEANETLVIDRAAMLAFAEKHNIVVVSVENPHATEGER